MRDAKGTAFRGLTPKFLSDLQDVLRPILDFEKNHRNSFIIEIRDNYLDLYFLGHAVKVSPAGADYNLSSAEAFRPVNFEKWPVTFRKITETIGFASFMEEVMAKIVIHKNGDISEGVSEINHYVNNRIVGPKNIMVIDRQVTYGRARIDLLGLKRMPNGKLSFVIIELKNKENSEIETVFNQIEEYLNILRNNYDDFKMTYEGILDQKIKLSLLDRRNKSEIASRDPGAEKIEGIVVLDNYNIRSDRLKRAVTNWADTDNPYGIKLFLKTNVFDERFFMTRDQAIEFTSKY